MRLKRTILAAATLIAALLIGLLTTAAPASAQSICMSDNPPDWCFAPPPPPPPPAAPVSLHATAVYQTNVSMAWSMTVARPTHVTRTVNGVTSPVADLLAGQTAWADTAAPAGAAITYKVYASACNDSGCTDGSPATLNVTTHPLPAAPGGSESTALNCSIYWCPKNPSSFTMSGWAIDWDTTAPIQVAFIQDGNTTVKTVSADGAAGTNAVYPGYGDNHGYASGYLTTSAVKGNHTVCAVALNIGGGSNTNLGCYGYYTPGAPSAASNLTATSNGSRVTVTFRDNADDENGYYLQRSTDAGGSWLQVGSQYPALAGTGKTGTVIDYSSVAPGTCYRILMTNAWSTASPQACIA